MDRIHSFPSIDRVRNAEFYIEKSLASILPRHSGNEWFVGGDFEEVVQIAHAALMDCASGSEKKLLLDQLSKA